jgi:LysM repeat protein
VLVIIIPLSVHAGLFSQIVSTLGTAADASALPGSQPADVKVLTAHLTPSQLSARGGGDVIVTDGALVPGGVTGEDILADRAYASGEITLYQVREGDTLSQIAEMFDVNSNTILWANDLTSAKAIRPGDTLVILPIVGVQHIVAAGDTIASIAKRYEGDEQEIRSYNQIAADAELTVGSTIVIPGGNMHRAAPTRVAESRSSGGATGSFTHPAPGTVKTQGIHGYNGVDFGGSIGTPILAAAAGEVIVSRSGGWNGGYGNYIVIRHRNGTQTLYAHLSRNDVGVGATVAAGEQIGALGNTGRSTGPHLHFEVRGARNPF